MRVLDHVLYAITASSGLVTIDPSTGVATVVAGLGRANAMELVLP